MAERPEAGRADVDDLERFARDVLATTGLSAEDARLLARSLVDADVHGVSTHGVARLGSYTDQLLSGQVAPRPVERTVLDRPAALLVDAGGGFGAPVGVRSLTAAMERARGEGVCLVGVRNVAHFGAAGFYTRHAAERGFLALAMSSTSPSVVPYGGRTPRIGNSPMSFATPGVEHPELVMDMAQSMTSRGRIKVAQERGDELPEGWAIDADGQPTRDPGAALAGAVLASGGHKGSALSLVVEMLASGLSGAHLSADIRHAGFTSAAGGPAGDQTVDVTVGNAYLVVDADVFGDATGVRRRASAIAEHVRTSPPAPGVDHVRAPGDLESERAQQSRAEGVELLPSTVAELAALAGRCDVDPVRVRPVP